MIDSQARFEWFRNTYQKYAGDLRDVNDWQELQNAAIYRKHIGDLDGAIEAMVKAINLARTMPNLTEKTATMLNYLAGELYSAKGATEEAEEAIQEGIRLSRNGFPSLLADNLWILASIQFRKGRYGEAMPAAEEARQLYQQLGRTHGVEQAEQLIERITDAKNVVGS
jgi:tetratricopeptide (TPR) repeat protein